MRELVKAQMQQIERLCEFAKLLKHIVAVRECSLVVFNARGEYYICMLYKFYNISVMSSAILLL